MSKSVATDLSGEKPGRHNFKIEFRVPRAGWFRLSAKSPDRAPAATAAVAVAFSVAALAIPLILGLTAAHARMPAWTILAAAAAFTATMICETRLALWWEHERVRYRDFTKTEGDPTDKAIVLLEHQPAEEQQTLELEAGNGQQLTVSINWDSPPRSLAGLGMAVLILAVAGLIPAAALTMLAPAVYASAPVTLATAITAFTAAAACGTVMLIRVEQLDRDTPRPPPRTPPPG
jgi:hypothetical protein